MNDSFTLLFREKLTLIKLRIYKRLPANKIYHCAALFQHGFLKHNHLDEKDPFGEPIHDGTYSLSEYYYRYLVAHRWFTLEYVIKNILVPIIIGVASAYITTLFLY